MMTSENQLPAHDDISAFLADAVELDPPTDPVPSMERLTEELICRGLRPGEVVLIGIPNSKAMLACYFAVLSAGGVPAPITAGTPRKRAETLASRLSARFMLILHSAAGHRPLQRTQICPGVDAVTFAHEPGCLQPGQAIVTTSGTSGAFSACLHSFSSLMRNARRHAAAVGLRSSDIMLVTLPMYFSYALVGQALAALDTGSRLVIAAPPFSPDSFRAALAAHDVTTTSLTPYMVRPLLAATGGSFERLRMMTVGGDVLDPRLTSQLRSMAPHLELYLTYGLTEAGPRVSTLAAHLEPSHRLSSVGKPLPGVNVALRNCSDDGIGELVVSTDTAMLRRVGSGDDNTTRALLGPGQVLTGDLFRIDDDGYLYFVGRRSEFLVSRGMKVFLPSIRRIANQVPGVISCSTRRNGPPGDAGHYVLDIYAHDHTPHHQQRIKRAVLQQLLRAERPQHIRVLPADQLSHK